MTAHTGKRNWLVPAMREVCASLVAALLVLPAALVALAPTAGAGTVVPNTATVYQLSLGDSLANGTGASTPANQYVNLIAAHEAGHFPGLQVENLSCGGATTNSMIDATDPRNIHCQAYTGGTQLSGAEAFLRAHPGQVPYITIDIGANNVDGCLTGGTVSLSCITTGLGQITAQLPTIVRGLESAAPGVPVFGMDYYNPFLAEWVIGGAGGPALARESAPLSAILNGSLVNTYGANGAIPVDVQGAFATQDFAMTGTWAGVTVPQNVARTCEWTHMCDNSGLTIHTNDIGHAKVAGAFEQQIDRWLRGGGKGAWLADAAGGVHLVGNALSFGSMAGQHLNKPVVTMAATTDGQGYWLVASDGLTGHHDQGDGVHVGIGQRGHDVGGPGATGDDGHPRPAGDLGVPLGHVTRPLLVADQDVPDRRVDDRVVDGEDGAAGKAEHDLHLLHLQALDQRLCSCEFHRGAPLSTMVGGGRSVGGETVAKRRWYTKTTSRLGGRRAHTAGDRRVRYETSTRVVTGLIGPFCMVPSLLHGDGRLDK